MKSILVVEDDQFFRTAIKDILEKNGHKVFEAPNGKIAKNVIEVTPLDLILSDIQMPHCDGIELLGWVQNNKKELPFVLMTGFSQIMETQKAFDLGATGFMAKPFNEIQLIEEIQNILKLSSTEVDESEETELDDQSFCKVSIDEFVSRSILSFDIYVRLKANKFVKIGHKGSEIPTERKENYKQKGLKFLYLIKEDFRELVKFNLDLSKLIKRSDKFSIEKKTQFMKYTGEVILERAFVEGVDQESFNDAKEFLGSSIDVLTDNDVTFNLLSHLNTHSDHLYAHSIGVSMFSIMISRKMDHSSTQTFFKLSMAGLFHDIGKKEIDPEILNKARPQLSYKERQIIESHATRGKEILSSLKSIPSDIVQITYEHHEDSMGQGYPRGLTKTDMHPLTEIVNVANIFVGYAIKGAEHNGVPGKKAIEQMEIFHENKFNPIVFSALKSIFN